MPSVFVLYWLVGSYFVWWATVALLERTAGLAPRVFPTAELQAIDARNARRSGVADHLAVRLTRAVGADERFRMQPRPAVCYAKALWELSLLGVAAAQALLPGGLAGYVELFVRQSPDSINMVSCQVAAALVVSWYLFELPMLLQYRRLSWSENLHHWLTIAAALGVLSGRFSPYSIWYGIVALGPTFPVAVVLGLRQHAGPRHAALLRRLTRMVTVLYPVLVVLGVVGTAAILARGLWLSTLDGLTVAVVAGAMAAWAYDDLQLVRFLRRASGERYETVDLAAAAAPRPESGGASVRRVAAPAA